MLIHIFNCTFFQESAKRKIIPRPGSRHFCRPYGESINMQKRICKINLRFHYYTWKVNEEQEKSLMQSILRDKNFLF